MVFLNPNNSSFVVRGFPDIGGSSHPPRGLRWRGDDLFSASTISARQNGARTSSRGGHDMASIADYASLSDTDHSRELRKAVIAATVGTTIEWYDFFLYGTAAGLVFGKLYFPNSDPTTATLLAFSTYFVGFASRPLGAAIFGHYGDRIGRKATLIATLMLMGAATFLIAFVPDYSSIGIWGGIILTVLRALQGIGVGGEWGGAMLLS